MTSAPGKISIHFNFTAESNLMVTEKTSTITKNEIVVLIDSQKIGEKWMVEFEAIPLIIALTIKDEIKRMPAAMIMIKAMRFLIIKAFM